MKLSELYRPSKLTEIIGQPPVRLLRAYAMEPYPACFLIESSCPGVGKSSAAFALAHELGCHDEFSGLHVVTASELTVDLARQIFGRDLHLRPMESTTGWHTLVIEELEFLSPQCVTFLKTSLEMNMPRKCCVVATSNGSTKLNRALLQRFTLLSFSGGPCFASAVQERLACIWAAEFPAADLPLGFESWGWSEDRTEFSMRSALDRLQSFGLCLATA